MKYVFPKKLKIDSYLKAIGDSEQFVVSEDRQSSIRVITYRIRTKDTFPNPSDLNDPDAALNAALLRECRGIKFDIDTGEVVSRPYHKFFNVGECDETRSEKIDWSQPHWVMEKLDGSMLTPFFRKDGRWEWHTKRGATRVAQPVMQYVANCGIQYEKFNAKFGDEGWTPIYEWCSRQQRIVIDYPTECLILTGMRNIETGNYMIFPEMDEFARSYGIPVVSALENGVSDIEKFVEDTGNLIGAEGSVVRFQNGHMTKLKGRWYCRIHKTNDTLRFEKDVWSLILNEQMDDVKAFLGDKEQAAIENFSQSLYSEIAKTGHRISNIVQEARIKCGDDRKKFATELLPSLQLSSAERSLVFQIWDGHDAMGVVINHLKKSVFTEPRLNAARDLAGNLRWSNFHSAVEEG